MKSMPTLWFGSQPAIVDRACTLVLRLIATTLLTIAALAVSTLPATAHDTLIDSLPAQDATITAPVRSIVLTFNAQTLPTGSRVVVKASDDSIVADGSGNIDQHKVILPLEPALEVNGTYTVAWRVVSSDGHPIQGGYTFTVSGLKAASTQPSPQDVASTPVQDNAAADGDTSSTTTSPALIAAIAVTALAVTSAVVFAFWRARRTPGQE